MRTALDAAPARRLNNTLAWVAVLTLIPGLCFMGWRVVLVVAGVLFVAHLTRRLMTQESLPKRSWWPMTLPVDALLLCGLLPAEWAGSATRDGWRGALWPAIAIAAIGLVLFQRLRRASVWPAFDPIVVVALLLHGVIGGAMHPAASVQRSHILTGDVAHAIETLAAAEPWYERQPVQGETALRTPWVTRQLDAYLGHGSTPVEEVMDLDSLMRDRMPPLEDLVLGGHPMPIGMASGVVLIGIILWASYRRTIDWRIPLIAVGTCYVLLVLLPVPTSILPGGRNWRFFAAAHTDVGIATGLTFVHYVLFASPILFTLGLIASRGDVRPIHGRAIVAWSALLGAATAAATLYVSVATGPLVAALPAAWVARLLDHWLAPRPLTLPRAS